MQIENSDTKKPLFFNSTKLTLKRTFRIEGTGKMIKHDL
jgi:hypothetical protein